MPHFIPFSMHSPLASVIPWLSIQITKEICNNSVVIRHKYGSFMLRQLTVERPEIKHQISSPSGINQQNTILSFNFSTDFPTSFHNLANTPIQIGSSSASVLGGAVAPFACVTSLANRYQRFSREKAAVNILNVSVLACALFTPSEPICSSSV